MKKRKILYLIITAMVLIIILFIYLSNFKKIDPYSFKGNRIYYSENRGKVDYEMIKREENDNLIIYNITFNSKDFLKEKTIIHGLLFIPKNKNNLPGVIIAPGGGVEKEKRIDVSKNISSAGYIVLTIDQRGIGETGGTYLGFEDDYNVFMNNNEPIQHLSVYDLLRSYDVLKKIPEVDDTKIALIGESMGARYAMIASAIDKRIKGVIVVSSSGFDLKFDPNNPYSIYLLSIDPDNYVSRISPNPIFFIQDTNDSVVSLDSVKKTYNKAKDPKDLTIISGCAHGFCEKMNEYIIKYLEDIFNKQDL